MTYMYRILLYHSTYTSFEVFSSISDASSTSVGFDNTAWQRVSLQRSLPRGDLGFFVLVKHVEQDNRAPLRPGCMENQYRGVNRLPEVFRPVDLGTSSRLIPISRVTDVMLSPRLKMQTPLRFNLALYCAFALGIVMIGSHLLLKG